MKQQIVVKSLPGLISEKEMSAVELELAKTFQTRQRSQVFGLGPAICIDDATITGTRLPSCRQVLRCMVYHCSEASHAEQPASVGAPSRFTTAKLVLQQVATFYQKANIPIISEPVRTSLNCWIRTTNCENCDLLIRLAVTQQPLRVNYRVGQKNGATLLYSF